MSTIIVRLPAALKARVARATKAAGTTSHNFILEAIAEKVDLAEQRTAFHALADERYATFLETGESIPWEQARTWLRQRLVGKPMKCLVARKQGR